MRLRSGGARWPGRRVGAASGRVAASSPERIATEGGTGTMIKLARVAVLVAIGTLTVSNTVWAQAQSKDQQNCITKVNRDGLKTHETQAKINRACVKDVGKGKVPPSMAEACLTADPQGQIM